MSPASKRVHQELSTSRLSRLPRFVLCACVGWGFFATKNYITDCLEIGLLCLAGLLIALLIYGLTGGSERQQKIVASIFLFLNILLITAIAVLTGQHQSCSAIFLCGVGVFASHILGIRAAIAWSVICSISLFVIHHGFIIGEVEPILVYSPIERTLQYVAAIAMLFFFSSQAQHDFTMQTADLVELTEVLESKAEEFEHLAKHDPLTGLENRRSFRSMLAKNTDECKASDSRFLLLLLDLDGFKEVNDSGGHQTGDLILKAVADRLNNLAGEGNHVSRLGGDEFTILIRKADWMDSGWNDEAMRKDLETLAAKLVQPFCINGQDFVVEVSTGSAKFPEDSSDPSELLSCADTAMYVAKRNEDRLQTYHPRLTRDLTRHQILESKSREAAAKNEFRVFYQPQIDVRSGRLIGAEALLRWKSDGIWIKPSEFIPLLESNREILRVGKWVLSQACDQVRRWSQRGFDIDVSVNVSSIQFQHGDFLGEVLDALESSGIDPKRLDLEITESLLIRDLPQATRTLDQLRELGVSVSIDDFGTGYSSLSYLRDLPLTRLKIDRSFISNIGKLNDGVIAQTIINLAHNIGNQVVAEGVETIEQLDFLKKHGCDFYQGFYHSKPLPAADFLTLLEQSQTCGWVRSRLKVD